MRFDFSCWGALACGAGLAALAWVVPYLSSPLTVHWRDEEVHFLPSSGNLVFCNQTGLQEAGDLERLVVNPATVIAPSVRNFGCEIPGFEFQYCHIGYGVIWSVTLSNSCRLSAWQYWAGAHGSGNVFVGVDPW